LPETRPLPLILAVLSTALTYGINLRNPCGRSTS
jgi:hypothetical protein